MAISYEILPLIVVSFPKHDLYQIDLNVCLKAKVNTQ